MSKFVKSYVESKYEETDLVDELLERSEEIGDEDQDIEDAYCRPQSNDEYERISQ